MSDNSLMVQGSTFESLKEQCALLLESKFLPVAITTTEQAMAIALKGGEVGLPIMQAFAQINVIGGKPAISAEGMNFLIRKNCPGAKIEVLERSLERCKIRASRPHEIPTEFEFSMDDAKRALLLGNQSWQKYPKAMLFARCMSEVARTMFPDAIGGLSYTPEELGAVVDIEGKVIE